MKLKNMLMLAVMTAALTLQGCKDKDPRVTLISNDMDFKAVNLTVGDGSLVASSNQTLRSSWSVEVTIGGKTTTVSGESARNELPVLSGDEIEITFDPASGNETHATISLPDGTSRVVTASQPSFKWTVPDDFFPGMEIKGETAYELDDTDYIKKGTIILVALM